VARSSRAPWRRVIGNHDDEAIGLALEVLGHAANDAQLTPSRSLRDMPGLRGMPAVTMATSLPARSSQLDVP